MIEYDLPVIQIGSDERGIFDTDVRVDVHAFEKFICEHTFYTYFLSKNREPSGVGNDSAKRKRIRYGRTVEKRQSESAEPHFFMIFRKSKKV